jgi:hypothetical protein
MILVEALAYAICAVLWVCQLLNIPPTRLQWSGMNTLIFVINKDFTIFNISHHANMVSVCLCQEILIHLPVREFQESFCCILEMTNLPSYLIIATDIALMEEN